ncbi:hypothetical protein, partial [Pectobacterium carotovorum]|uniref:hypothetical protein n=1 Tax=Pectobacterium brasiliense TaxID=180957 RepID=UPI000BC9AE77
MKNKFLEYNYYIQKRMGFFNFIEIVLCFILVGFFSKFSYMMVFYKMVIVGDYIGDGDFNYAMISLVLTIFPVVYTLSYGCSPLQKILLFIFKVIPSRKDFFIYQEKDV